MSADTRWGRMCVTESIFAQKKDLDEYLREHQYIVDFLNKEYANSSVATRIILDRNYGVCVMWDLDEDYVNIFAPEVHEDMPYYRTITHKKLIRQIDFIIE